MCPSSTEPLLLFVTIPLAGCDHATFERAAVTVEGWSNRPDDERLAKGSASGLWRLDGAEIGLSLVSNPLDSGAIARLAEAEWSWPDALRILRAHTAYFVLTVTTTSLRRVEAKMLLSKAAALVVEASHGLAVIDDDAHRCIAAAEYVAAVRDSSEECLPLTVWLRFDPIPEAGGWSVMTTGMANFGYLDFEMTSSVLSPPQMMGTIAEVGSYQLRHDVSLDDGDTIETSLLERAVIRRQPSRFRPGTTVRHLIPQA